MKRRNGFTLVELLAVIGTLLPSLDKARARAASINCPADAVPNLLTPAHPGKTNNFLFADGHVERMHYEDTYPRGVAGTLRPAQGMWRRSGL